VGADIVTEVSDDQLERPEVLAGPSPSLVALSAVADKWLVLAVHALQRRPLRFGELKHRLDRVTTPTLTRTLRHMETVGLVTRTIYPEVPPRVEYALTERGRSLAAPVAALATWAMANMETFPLPDDLERA
jgi:DNA-binding HxlR family transcriptional regulator